MRTLTKLFFSMILLSIIIISSCKKNEFLPENTGNKVITEKLNIFEESIPGEATLFKLAWDKADIKKYIIKEYPFAKLTFFIPSNSAMEKLGLNKHGIEMSTQSDLAKLIKYHIITDAIPINQLKNAFPDIMCPTLLVNPKYYYSTRTTDFTKTEVYRYNHYLKASENSIFVNGKRMSLLKEIPVFEGQAFLINSVLEVPERQMIDVLKSDKRLSLYNKALELSLPFYERYYSKSYGNFATPLHYSLDFFYTFPNSAYESNTYKRDLVNLTLFPPTNEAFNEIGIFNEKDLIALNNRIPPNSNFPYGHSTPIDSLLRYQNYHSSGGLIIQTTNPSKNGIGVISGPGMIWFTTIFDEIFFPKYMISNSMTYDGKFDTVYPDFTFKTKNNKINLSHKNSNIKDAEIIESDINTIQGPIHIVNRILVPKDFTMWHLKK